MVGGDLFLQFQIRLPNRQAKRKIIGMVAIAKNVRNSILTPSPTKKMEPSSAIDAEWDGNSLLSELELEVQESANSQTVEMILLLIDKWEREIETALERG